MKRREFLKRLGLATGSIIIAPSLLQSMETIQVKKETIKPSRGNKLITEEEFINRAVAIAQRKQKLII